jgi:hypothetical protein
MNAICDVSDDGGKLLHTVYVYFRYRYFHGEQGSIAMQSIDAVSLIHLSRIDGRMGKMIYVCVVLLAKTLREEANQGLTDHLGLRIPEQVLSCTIKQCDVVLLIDRYDRVVRSIHHGSEAGGTYFQLVRQFHLAGDIEPCDKYLKYRGSALLVPQRLQRKAPPTCPLP